MYHVIHLFLPIVQLRIDEDFECQAQTSMVNNETYIKSVFKQILMLTKKDCIQETLILKEG